MSDDGSSYDHKLEKTKRRIKRRQRFLEALTYHHKPSAESLKKTTVKGGSSKGDNAGINQDIESKVGEGLHRMRSGIHRSRNKARKRSKSLFKE